MSKRYFIHKSGIRLRNILHCFQRRTKPRPQVTCIENLVKNSTCAF